MWVRAARANGKCPGGRAGKGQGREKRYKAGAQGGEMAPLRDPAGKSIRGNPVGAREPEENRKRIHAKQRTGVPGRSLFPVFF